MAPTWPLKRVFLRTLIVAVVGSAAVGIFTFLFGDFGETEAKLLLTTLSISYFSSISLACAAALEKRRFPLLASAGLVTGIAGFLAFLPGIWAEWFDNQSYGKAMLVLGIFGFSFAQACLLGLVPLARSTRWVLLATIGILLALATLISGMILFEADDQWLFRIAGVLGILDGCGSVLIPVLYKLGAKDILTDPQGPIDRIELLCPRCGHRDTYTLGELTCGKCALRMRFEITPDPRAAIPGAFSGDADRGATPEGAE